MIALDDLAKGDYGHSKGIMICGNKKLNREKLESHSLVNPNDAKGRSISYFAAGKDTLIKYFTGDNYVGVHKTFYPDSPPIVSMKIGGELMNDRIHSLEVVTDAFDGVDIPTECPF